MGELNKLWSIDAEVRSIQRTIEGLEENMIAIRASRIKEISVQESNKSDDKLEETIMRVDGLKRRLNNNVEYLIKQKETANKKIDKLDCGIERAILRDRYFNRLSMEQIAKNLHYSNRSTERYHRSAVKNYKKIK